MIKRVGRLLPGILVLACSLAGSDLLPGRFFRFERLQPGFDGTATVGFSSISQDAEGFLWLGTGAGLIRYDGYRFKLFPLPGEPGRPARTSGIYPVTISRSGAIWVGTTGRGLFKFSRENEAYTAYDLSREVPDGLSNDIVMAVQEDRQGRLWIGTRARGLIRLDPATGSAWRAPLGPGAAAVGDVLADRNGAIWVGTLEAGLFKIDPATEGILHFHARPDDPRSLGSNCVWTLFEDREGTLWIGTKNGGLGRFNPDRRDFVRYFGDGDRPNDLAGQTISAIAEDTAGRLWLGTVADGLRVFDRTTGELVPFRHDPQDPESLGDDSITSIARDVSGLIWVGTVRGGLNKCLAGRAKFEHYKRNASNPRSLGHNDVRALWSDGRGRLWVGTKAGQIEGIDPMTRQVTRSKLGSGDVSEPEGPAILALRGDASGRLWIGTESDGLARLDPVSGRIDRYRHAPDEPNGLSNNRVNALWTDEVRPDVLWIGTQHGLNRFEMGLGRWTRYLHDLRDPESLCNDIVTAIREDGAGRLWIGTRGGLSRLDKATGRCESFVSRPEVPAGTGISDDIVNCVHVDVRGIVWIGTNAGLNRFDTAGGEWRVFAQKDGLAGEVVCGIQEDAEGALWVSTNRGLSRLDPGSGVAKSYGPRDGLQSGAFNPGAFAAQPGRPMFFGGTIGLNAFDPRAIRKSAFVPPVVWTAYSRNNIEVELPRSFYAARALKLPYRTALITLEFAALDFAAPELNSFAYRLEPRDTAWTSLIPDHRINLVGLGAGDLRLRVIAANPDGTWNEEGLTVGIEVRRPFWRTWGFLLAVVALLASGAALAVRARRKAGSALQHLGEDLEGVLGSYGLTVREEEILRFILRGAGNKDIGERLFISSSTVRNHISNIYRKLGVRSRLELIRRISGDAREARKAPK
jgi:ligand-binding sensor domain-containing protein/DNA-binding CsgD family transcriptional regulator